MNEQEIKSFWEENPCGESFVNALDANTLEGYKTFFNDYDHYRYNTGGHGHILKCFDQINFSGKQVLEIGLGQGADSEQIIRRGGIWSGLDLTSESVNRVKTRFEVRSLPYQDIKQGSAVSNPYPSDTFDIVYSHGVLHHIPEIISTQKEIHRVLKADGELIIMMYAKWSLNYLLSIAVLRRLGLILLYLFNSAPNQLYANHLKNAKSKGLFKYLKLDTFTHYNTDGPLNPYALVYDRKLINEHFPNFEITKTYKRYMHAPPLKLRWLPFEKLMGWHLWIHLQPKN